MVMPHWMSCAIDLAPSLVNEFGQLDIATVALIAKACMPSVKARTRDMHQFVDHRELDPFAVCLR